MQLKIQRLCWQSKKALKIACAVAAVSLGILSDLEPARSEAPKQIYQPSFSRQRGANLESAGTQRFCSRDLQSAIAAIVERPTFKTAQWGILIEPLFEATSLYRHNSDTFLIPASNIKLFTTAAALRTFGDRSDALASLTQWLMVINQHSDNDYADRLLNHIGGQTAVQRLLAPLGVIPDSYRQIDGSGLSRNNLAQPTTFVTLLKGMYTYDRSGLFYRSLPVAGVNGTLQNRFRTTIAQGRVHAKTGTLRGVKALSGYMENADYGQLVFSIVVNQPGQSAEVLSQAIDQIVLQSVRVNRCS